MIWLQNIENFGTVLHFCLFSLTLLGPGPLPAERCGRPVPAERWGHLAWDPSGSWAPPCRKVWEARCYFSIGNICFSRKVNEKLKENQYFQYKSSKML